MIDIYEEAYMNGPTKHWAENITMKKIKHRLQDYYFILLYPFIWRKS